MLLFQFPPQGDATTREAPRFAERLHRFLSQLPPNIPYAVEIRDGQLFIADYVAALTALNVPHTIVVHPRMPAVARQLGCGGCSVLLDMTGWLYWTVVWASGRPKTDL